MKALVKDMSQQLVNRSPIIVPCASCNNTHSPSISLNAESCSDTIKEPIMSHVSRERETSSSAIVYPEKVHIGSARLKFSTYI